jgi:hypothetical protein
MAGTARAEGPFKKALPLTLSSAGLRDGAATHLAGLYGTALLVAALLLFWIQPLYTKVALPYFGGTPAVWTTASMFFQLALLAGYLYAHVVSQTLRFRSQVFLHDSPSPCRGPDPGPPPQLFRRSYGV